MAWIESHQSLRLHPKTRKLARQLGGLPTAIGHLHCLWWWCLDYAPDGDLSTFDASDIADGAEWSDDPETFMAALLASGFLDSDLYIHDWYDFAGRLIERQEKGREANRERQKRYREKHNALVTRDVTESNGPTEPNRTEPTVPNLTEPPKVSGRRPPVDNSDVPVSSDDEEQQPAPFLGDYSHELAKVIKDRKQRGAVASEVPITDADRDLIRQLHRLLAHVRFLSLSKLGEYVGTDGFEERVTAAGRYAIAGLAGADNPAAVINERVKVGDLNDLIGDEHVTELRKKNWKGKAA